MLARKVYPGKAEKHVVDLSASEITRSWIRSASFTGARSVMRCIGCSICAIEGQVRRKLYFARDGNILKVVNCATINSFHRERPRPRSNQSRPMKVCP